MFEQRSQFLFYGGTKTKHKTQFFLWKDGSYFFIWMHNHRTQENFFSIEGHITIFILLKHNHKTQETILIL